MSLLPSLEPLAQVATLPLLAAAGYAWLAVRALAGRSGACPRPVLSTGRGFGWPLLALALWLGLDAVDPLLRAAVPAPFAGLLQTLPALAVAPALLLSQRVQPIPAKWSHRAGALALLSLPAALAVLAALAPGRGPLAGAEPALERTLAALAGGMQGGYALACGVAAGVLARRRYRGVAGARRAEWGAALAATVLPVLVALLFAAQGGRLFAGLTHGLVAALPLLAWLLEGDHAGRASLRRMLDALGSPTLLVDDRCLAIHTTPAALRLLGLETAPPDAHINTLAPLLGRLLLAGRTSGRIGLRGAGGEPIEVEVVVARCDLGRFGFAGRIVTLRELTRQRELVQRIRRMAFHDELTGIANRRSFMKELGRSLARIAETGGAAALLYLDLDGFKELNDSLGHAAGDEALRTMAHRLRQTLRQRAGAAGGPHTSLARIGGDEFAILVKGFERLEQVEALAASVLALAREPLWTTDQNVSLSFSIGAAFAPADGSTPKELFQRADLALYHAKRAGSGHLVRFDLALEAETSRTSDVKHHLRSAIEREEFRVHYQPKIDLRTREIIGAEALLRWRHEALGSVGPAEFIPIAEAANLIEGIGTWVLEAACQQIRDWRDAGLTVPPIAVNVSSRQVGDDFPKVVSRALRRFALEPQAIEIELTESTLLTQSGATDRCLAELDAMGIRIALDDFGTGYSALAYLTRMPLSVLKLDRSLVRNIHDDRNAANVSAAVISMAHGLGLRVVAEGVDCAEQVVTLCELGCDEAQGFLFAAALPPPEFAALLEGEEGSGASAEARRADAVRRAGAASGAAPDPAPAVVPVARPVREALPDPDAPDAAPPPERAPTSDTRFALLVDDGTGALGTVALDLTRLGVLVLYTTFQDEAHLMVEQEPGNIRALLISPGVDLGRIETLARQISRSLGGAPVTRVVVGLDPGPERRAELRAAGVSWALWSPFDDDALRFIVESALLLPSEMASRAEPRIPADLSVAVSTPRGSGLGRILSLSAGGAYIHAADLPEPGGRIDLGFGLDGAMIETAARVAHVSERQVSWKPSFPRGFGVAFEDLAPEDEAQIREYVKATLARYSP